MIAATITAIRQATPTVKVFTFHIDAPFEFRPGQWLDCYVDIDGQQEVGGYSMTSSPLADHVELAIKYSESNPVTRYLHGRAAVGERLHLDGGYGECYYEPGMAESLVLIAGGIGLTPLMSIIRYATVATPDVPLTLLYAATSPDEHLFRDELEATAARDPRFRCEFFVTRGAPEGALRGGHIDQAVLQAVIEPGAVYFVCGPGAMIDSTVDLLTRMGVPPERIRFERWW